MRMIFYTKPLMSLSALLLLSACSTGMKTSFDCNSPDGQGLGCASVQHVNGIANQGGFNMSDGSGDASTNNAPQAIPVNQRPAALAMGYPVVTPSAGDPLRDGEVVQRMWLAPWLDQTGMYHGASYLTFVLKRSHWFGAPTTGSSAPVDSSGDDNSDGVSIAKGSLG